jgi:hypothetical protein
MKLVLPIIAAVLFFTRRPVVEELGMISKLKICLITLGICGVAFSVTCTAKSDLPVSPYKVRLSAEKGQQSQTALSVGQAEEDVAKLLARESSNLLILGTKLRVTPTYLWGDFNGDEAIDIAIVAALNVSVNFNTQPWLCCTNIESLL